jgi:hypothetical protein
MVRKYLVVIEFVDAYVYDLSPYTICRISHA